MKIRNKTIKINKQQAQTGKVNTEAEGTTNKNNTLKTDNKTPSRDLK